METATVSDMISQENMEKKVNGEASSPLELINGLYQFLTYRTTMPVTICFDLNTFS